MNGQTYSVVFCVLLASGFLHEIRAKAALNPEFARIKRSADPELVCRGRCNENSARTTLKVQANSNANLIAIINETDTSAVGVILDVKLHQALVVDESSTLAVLVSLSSGVPTVIDIGQVAPEIHIENLLVQLKDGFSPLLQLRVSTSASKDRLKLINKVVLKLVTNILVELKVNPESGLKVLKIVLSKLAELLQRPLAGYLKVLEDMGGVEVTEDLVGIVNVLSGYAVIIEFIPGGLPTLEKTNTRLGYNSTSTAQERLADVIRIVGSNFGLSKKFEKTLNDFKSEQILLSLLGGLENTLTNGIAKILATIASYLNGKISIAIVIQIIIQFLAASSQVSDKNKNLLAETNSNITDLIMAAKSIKADKELSEFIKNGEEFQNGRFTYQGTNMATISKIAIDGLNNETMPLLQILITDISEINGNIENDILSILLVLMLDLNSPLGIQLLLVLGWGAANDPRTEAQKHFLASKLSTVQNLTQRLKKQDLYLALTKIPVIEGILKLLSPALSSATNGKLSLETCVNSSPDFRKLITALFQIVTGQNLEADEKSLEDVKSMNHITDLDFLLGIAITVDNTPKGLIIHL